MFNSNTIIQDWQRPNGPEHIYTMSSVFILNGLVPVRRQATDELWLIETVTMALIEIWVKDHRCLP